MVALLLLSQLICAAYWTVQKFIEKGGLIYKKMIEWSGSHGTVAGEEPEERICPICQEALKEIVSTDCGHLFCRACLAQHVKTSTSELCCPTCRKPCSEGVLGTSFVCQNHLKRLCYFCEERQLLLCEECKKSPDHNFHEELTIEKAMHHYKERLNRMIKKLKKTIRNFKRRTLKEKNKKCHAMQESPTRGKRQLDDFLQKHQDQLEDSPAEGPRILDTANSMLTTLQKMVKEMDMSKLKDVKNLLHRSDLLIAKLKIKKT